MIHRAPFLMSKCVSHIYYDMFHMYLCAHREMQAFLNYSQFCMEIERMAKHEKYDFLFFNMKCFDANLLIIPNKIVSVFNQESKLNLVELYLGTRKDT